MARQIILSPRVERVPHSDLWRPMIVIAETGEPIDIVMLSPQPTEDAARLSAQAAVTAAHEAVSA
jgi:hypothetical protein